MLHSTSAIIRSSDERDAEAVQLVIRDICIYSTSLIEQRNRNENCFLLGGLAQANLRDLFVIPSLSSSH